MDDRYRKGYLAGYHAGYNDASAGHRNAFSDFSHVDHLPVEILSLSSRAFHCLHFAGCHNISDVAKLKEQEILQVRNLGKVTAAEIGRALLECGITGTDWETFL